MATEMPVEVALVPGRVFALAAGVAATDRDTAGRRSASPPSVGRESPVVDGGVSPHQRSAPEPSSALGTSVPGSGAVVLGNMFAQFRLADEREPAAFQRSLAALVHRRPVSAQVVLPVRRVPAVDARVRLCRPSASALDHLEIVGRHQTSVRCVARWRKFTDYVAGVSVRIVGVDAARFHIAFLFHSPGQITLNQSSPETV